MKVWGPTILFAYAAFGTLGAFCFVDDMDLLKLQLTGVAGVPLAFGYFTARYYLKNWAQRFVITNRLLIAALLVCFAPGNFSFWNAAGWHPRNVLVSMPVNGSVMVVKHSRGNLGQLYRMRW